MALAASGARPLSAVHGKYGDVLAAVSGVALPFSFAPYGLYLLAPIAMAGLFLSLDGQSPRRAAWRGFVFGVASFLTGVYWVHISIHVFGGAALGLALFLMMALVLFLSCYTAAFGFMAMRFFPDRSLHSFLLAMPALWTLLEWLRGWLFSGFPWLSVGYSQSDGPLTGIVPIVGVFGVSAAVTATAGALVAAAQSDSWRRRLAALVPVALLWLASGLLSNHEWTRDEGAPVKVSLVQGSVPQQLKWLPEQLQPTVDLYMRLTADHLDSNLIVWPEAAIPTARHNLEGLFSALKRRGTDTDTDFLIGAIEVERGTGRPMNSVVAVNRKDTTLQSYYKRHLVPFGEYFPVPDLVREWIRWMDLPYTDFAAGEDDQPLLEVAGHKVGVSICYEDVFGEELVGALPEAGFLVNVSNDAWFGGSVAPHQHLQIARLRALEAGRPLLRATNNGISAAIGPRGETHAVSPQFEPYVLTWTTQPRGGSTPYSRWANWPVVSLCFAALLLVWRRSRPSPGAPR